MQKPCFDRPESHRSVKVGWLKKDLASVPGCSIAMKRRCLTWSGRRTRTWLHPGNRGGKWVRAVVVRCVRDYEYTSALATNRGERRVVG